MVRCLAACTFLLIAACGSTASETSNDDASILECVNTDDCGLGEICVSNTCIPAGCDDGELSGNESDIDCGGDCLPCSEGRTCNGESDCSSRYCDGFNRCRDCESHGDCADAEGTYCSVGVCVDQLDDGVTCDEQQQCASGVCESEGVCCDVECGGDCATGICDELRDDGVSCSSGEQCLSGVCEDEGVCCNKACNADCSSGTCTLYGNGAACTTSDQCQGNVCAWEDVCCNATCDGECESGTCQPLEVFTNKSVGNCTTDLSNPISYSASIQVCIKGLRPDGTGQALGWASVGNLSCPSSGYTELDTNDDWTYNAATNVWTSPMDWIPATPYDFTPDCDTGQLCFTTCYKNKDASGAVHRVYTVIE